MRKNVDSSRYSSSGSHAQEIQEKPAFQPEREVLPASRISIHREGLLVQSLNINFKRRREAFQRLQTGVVSALNPLNCPDVQARHLSQLLLREMAAYSQLFENHSRAQRLRTQSIE